MHAKIATTAPEAMVGIMGAVETQEKIDSELCGVKPIMPEVLLDKLAHPVEPKPPRLTAYQHFIAAMRLLKDASIAELLAAETDFAHYAGPDVGEAKSLASAVKELCNELIEKRYQDGDDPFIAKYGDWR